MTPCPTQKIDEQIANALPWQAKSMKEFRELIKTKFPELKEDWKWMVGVWLYNGKLICAFSSFKGFVKFNFFRGSELSDPGKLFNSGLDSKSHRSLNIGKEGKFSAAELTKILRAAIALEK